MSLKIIEALKCSKPKKRGRLLEGVRAKNVAYFKRVNPALGDVLETLGSGGFVLRINEVFLDVVEGKTGNFCHPPGGLLEYAETLVSWHNSNWIDKIAATLSFSEDHEHGRAINDFTKALYAAVPQIEERVTLGVLRLPNVGRGRRFSGSTVFLGVLTGLQILQYLNTTEVSNVLIFEPDVNKFALSCCFVDYEAIERHFGRIMLVVGSELYDDQIDSFLGASPVLAGVWLRLQTAYPSHTFNEIINRIHLHWRATHELFVPYDRELRNLTYAAANIDALYPILCKHPNLSSACRIAVVASGPSLANDLECLKTNQQKLIIFAAHSVVRVLKQNGIKADFQFSLDTELTVQKLSQLELDPDIPLISYYKADPTIFVPFKTVLLVPESMRPNIVHFLEPVSYTHPTTGNLCLAVALFMGPSNVFLLGTDLGFRESASSHVAGTWHQEGDQGQRDTDWRDQVAASSNFEESKGCILTHAALDAARLAMEAGIAWAISEKHNTTVVFNFADGVRINGAEPMRSSACVLENYLQKTEDKKAIHSAFVAGMNCVYERYAASGSDMLVEMQQELISMLTFNTPTWPTVARAMDGAWSMLLSKRLMADPHDYRVIAYHRLLQDLLRSWCGIMLFTKSPTEFETAYIEGLKRIETIFNCLEWPIGLDL